MTTTELTVKATDLRNLLRIIVPFASTDKTLRIHSVECVCLDIADGQLVGQATDRYVIGRFAVPATGDLGGRKILLPRLAANLCLQLIGIPAKDAEARITVVGEVVTVTVSGLSWALPVDSGRPLLADAWIDTPHLMTKLNATPVEVSTIGINPALAAPFAAAVKLLREGAEWTFTGQANPIRLTIGPQFTGWMMPIKLYPPQGVTS